MSMNNVIVIKEFRIPGIRGGGIVSKTIFDIYDLCVDMDYPVLEITDADSIAFSLRQAIKMANTIESEYGLSFDIFDEEVECENVDPITEEYDKRLLSACKSWEGCQC